MNLCAIDQFEKLWGEVRPSIISGRIESRDQAYILFSQVLKISKLALQDEALKDCWFRILEQGSFSLCLEDSQLPPYNFNAIIELLKTGKDSFDVEVVEVEPSTADLSKIAESIHAIALSSLGDSPGASRFQTIITSPNTMCLLAREKETFIACAYGSYLELPQVNFFHLNFLGRRVEYPSVHIVEKLQNEMHRIQNRFPHVQYLTLCVSPSNKHMLPVYQGLGFQEIEYVEVAAHDEPTYFYGKKIDQNATVVPPSYTEYKAALEAQRNKTQIKPE